MNSAMGRKYYVTLIVGGLELPAAMLFIFQLQYLGTHPLRYDLGCCIGPEQEVEGQVKFAGNSNTLLAVFGMDPGFSFHVAAVYNMRLNKLILLFLRRVYCYALLHDGLQFVEPVVPHIAEGFQEVGNDLHL